MMVLHGGGGCAFIRPSAYLFYLLYDPQSQPLLESACTLLLFPPSVMLADAVYLSLPTKPSSRIPIKSSNLVMLKSTYS